MSSASASASASASRSHNSISTSTLQSAAAAAAMRRAASAPTHIPATQQREPQRSVRNQTDNVVVLNDSDEDDESTGEKPASNRNGISRGNAKLPLKKRARNSPAIIDLCGESDSDDED